MLGNSMQYGENAPAGAALTREKADNFESGHALSGVSVEAFKWI
jgi:hypothetical protein